MNCILCQLPLRLAWGICSQCLKHLPHSISACIVCGLPLFMPKERCHHCEQISPNWNKLIAVADYQQPFIRLIYQFKSNKKIALSYPLARLMFLAWYQKRQIYGLYRPDIVTCIPLSQKRYWLRGYNQSELLAKHISHWIRSDFYPYLLQRKHKTKEQKILSKQQRSKNVQDVFSCDVDLTGKTIAVIDDIVTTGQTIKEASKQLKLKGAKDIQILCLCRTNL